MRLTPCAQSQGLFQGLFMLMSLLISALSGSAHAALLTLMQPSIEPGGSFDILIESQDQAGAPPQLGWSPELEKHFQITWMDQSTESLNQGFQHRWLLTLRQRPDDASTGMLTLPPFTLGNDRTQPLRVMVTPPKVKVTPQTAQSTHEKVISIHQDLNHRQAYAGQTLVYRMEILYQGYPFDPSLSPLKMEGAQGRQLGEPIEHQVTLHGQRYQEARWRDLITINQAPARILPRQFSARLSPFPGSHQSRRHQAEAPAIDIEVLPKPAEFPETATWLPAEGLALDYDLPNTNHAYQAGDTLQLTVYLDAVGQQGRLLPTFPRLETEDYTVAPVRHHVQDRLVSQQLVGNLQQVMLVTLKRSGSIQLPTLSVPWWDVERHRLRHTELALPTLKVVPAKAVSSSTDSPSANSPSTAQTAVNTGTVSSTTADAQTSTQWSILIASVLASLVSIGVILWIHHRQRPQQRLARRIRNQQHWSHRDILNLLADWASWTGQPHPAWQKPGLLRVLRHAAAGHRIPQHLLAQALLGRRHARKGLKRQGFTRLAINRKKQTQHQHRSQTLLPPLYP
ncbi:hypothetical protein BFW38_10645 [Terasakiispira papahanaumokuakeensis]|uniref:Protein BatD n=1 Tax=Terasakiispira papahanaumokuakeensis TaxID=197479 RepID=A0A1E2VA86_9GAMM|nr:BatD family protein [Terasakiispira papahanaumokuakeensis]ODC03928.1 hypothetical protein BFW38_10645 [Terasakiispira papahanaumokuakeensis]